MAAVTIDQEATLYPAVPCWWRQRYTYVLAAVAGAHLVIGPVLMKLVEGASLNVRGVDELVMGLFLGQCYLLGLWAALGGLRAIPRWSIVGVLCVLGVASIVAAINRGQQTFFEVFLFACLLAVLFVTGVAMCLLPLRGLAGWRVDFDPAYYADLPLRRGQVSFIDYAAYTCAVAGPLVVVRLMLELSREDSAEVGSIIAVLILIGGRGRFRPTSFSVGVGSGSECSLLQFGWPARFSFIRSWRDTSTACRWALEGGGG